jgi:hypothetical protein
MSLQFVQSLAGYADKGNVWHTLKGEKDAKPRYTRIKFGDRHCVILDTPGFDSEDAELKVFMDIAKCIRNT